MPLIMLNAKLLFSSKLLKVFARLNFATYQPIIFDIEISLKIQKVLNWYVKVKCYLKKIKYLLSG